MPQGVVLSTVGSINLQIFGSKAHQSKIRYSLKIWVAKLVTIVSTLGRLQLHPHLVGLIKPIYRGCYYISLCSFNLKKRSLRSLPCSPPQSKIGFCLKKKRGKQGGYTTQLYRDCNKPLQGSLLFAKKNVAKFASPSSSLEKNTWGFCSSAWSLWTLSLRSCPGVVVRKKGGIKKTQRNTYLAIFCDLVLG